MHACVCVYPAPFYPVLKTVNVQSSQEITAETLQKLFLGMSGWENICKIPSFSPTCLLVEAVLPKGIACQSAPHTSPQQDMELLPLWVLCKCGLSKFFFASDSRLYSRIMSRAVLNTQKVPFSCAHFQS